MPQSHEAPGKAPARCSACARVCPPGSSGHVGPSWPSSGWVRPSVGITSNTGAPPPLSAAQTHTHALPHFIHFQEDFRVNSPKQGPPQAAPLHQDSNRDHPSPPQSSSAPSLNHGPNPWPPTPCRCPAFIWDCPAARRPRDSRQRR